MRASSHHLSGGQIFASLRGITLALVVASAARLTRGEVAIGPIGSAPPVSAPSALMTDALSTPTHHQTGVIEVSVSGLSCFCLTPDDRVLAGCGETGKGYVCVYDAAGKYVESWPVPVKPEAIFARGDGAIFLAGEGQLAKLSTSGSLEFQHEAPHAAAITASRDKIREEVIAENKQRAESYGQQAKIFEQMLEPVEKKIDAIKAQIAALDKGSEEQPAGDTQAGGDTGGVPMKTTRIPGNKQMLERQLAMQEQMKKQYEEAKAQWDEMAKQNPAHELTDAEIDEQVKSSMAYKLKASSISANDDNVFLATHAALGYGFEVWKMTPDFGGAQSIISDLSGCCGQMDVKVNADGLYVAENSRHRVCRYDTSGKLIAAWGQASRSGIEGFGSCCNPMNVAFGPGGVIYTSEDDTGRIKRYSTSGELLGLVGAVDVPPGCKNVSIAANSDGSRFYMLDITNNGILRMEPYGPNDAPKPMKFEEKRPEGAEPQDVQTSQSDSQSVGEMIVSGIQLILNPGK
jgi:hypothetical protein